MNVWVLVAILVMDSNFKMMPLGAFVSMDECFQAREAFMATGPKPKINYESVCIQTNQLEIL